MGKRKMSLQEATEFVDDDLPDGAYWAMAHDIAGAQYGDAWHELDTVQKPRKPKAAPLAKTLPCPICKKPFAKEGDRRQHVASAHAAGGKHPCPVCRKPFTQAAYMEQHLQAAHRKGSSNGRSV